MCVAVGLLSVAACGSAPATTRKTSPVVSCSTQVASAKTLTAAPPSTVSVTSNPTDVVAAGHGRWLFASLSTAAGAAVGVIRSGMGAKPELVRTVAVDQLQAGFGLALADDGTLLLVAGNNATAVLDVRALETGSGDVLRGLLRDGTSGQFEIAVSPHGRYVFITDESTGALSVFNLSLALRAGFSAPGVAVGSVPLATGAVGVTGSPDGRRIYVTTYGGYGDHGQLWAIDTSRAEHSPGLSALLGVVPAGCQPVRVAVSPDGHVAWVTALQSNALLGFNTSALLHDPSTALRAVVHVGSEPVGLVLVDDGRLALVADSNRGLVASSAAPVGPQTVSVIDTALALSSRPSLLGTIPAGRFPRDLSYDAAAGEVLLANYGSDTIETFKAPSASK